MSLGACVALSACSGTAEAPTMPLSEIPSTIATAEASTLPELDGKQHWEGNYDELIQAPEMPSDFVTVANQWRSPEGDEQVKRVLAAYYEGSPQCDVDGKQSCELRLTQEASLCQQLFDGYQPSITYLTSWNPGTKTWIFSMLDVYCPSLVPATAQRPTV